jgi:glycosyltransferase involved in cell wall biosynthesis
VRVGLVIYGSLDTQSGGYLYDRKLVECLRTSGDQVEIFSIPWRGYLTNVGNNFSADFTSQLAEAKVDILLQDELNHPSLFWLNPKIQQTARFPLVSIVHHLRSSEKHAPAWMPFYRQIERAYLNSVDGFIFNSQTTRRAVAQLLGRMVEGCVATPAGDRFNVNFTEDEIRARNANQGPVQLLFVGNLIARKGLDILLRALGQLRSLDWRLRIAGRMDVDSHYSTTLRRLAINLGLAERVVFLGSVSESMLESEYRQSQILIVPSQYEGFGIVYLEGMAFGIPAVGTKAGGAEEIIQNGINGLLIVPGDIKALTDGLESLLANRDTLLRMSLAAHRRFGDFPGWGLGMDAVRTYLHSLCK